MEGAEGQEPIVEKEEELIYLFRGVSKEPEGERAGRWWSTNPYYALNKAGGALFVAVVHPSEIEELGKDVSLEAEYENYFFKEQDPSNTRLVTADELRELESRATYKKAKIGGTMMKSPDDPVAVGREIFSPKSEKAQ